MSQKIKRAVPRSKDKQSVKTSPNICGAIFYPAVWGSCAFVIGLIIFSYLLTKVADPDRLMPALCLVLAGISGVVCGYSCKRLCGHNSAISVVSGLIMVGLLLIASLFSGGEYETSTLYKSAVIVLFPASSFIASLQGNKKKKRKP